MKPIIGNPKQVTGGESVETSLCALSLKLGNVHGASLAHPFWKMAGPTLEVLAGNAVFATDANTLSGMSVVVIVDDDWNVRTFAEKVRRTASPEIREWRSGSAHSSIHGQRVERFGRHGYNPVGP